MNRIDGMQGSCLEACDIAKGSEHWDKFTGICQTFGRAGDDPVKCYMGWNNESTYIIAGALQDKESLGSRFIEFVYSLPPVELVSSFLIPHTTEGWISYENFIDFMRDEYEDFDNLEAMGTPEKYLGLSCIQQSAEGRKETESEDEHDEDCRCADDDHGHIGWNDPILNTDELDTLLLSMYLNTDFSSDGSCIALEPAKKIKQTSGKPELRRGKR